MEITKKAPFVGCFLVYRRCRFRSSQQGSHQDGGLLCPGRRKERVVVRRCLLPTWFQGWELPSLVFAVRCWCWRACLLSMGGDVADRG
jgi:hypothetical protein